MDGDTLRTEFPVFQWTPLQVPLDYQINYVVQIAEILPGQMPLQALSSNILHFEVTDLNQDYLLYPPDGQREKPMHGGYRQWTRMVFHLLQMKDEVRYGHLHMTMKQHCILYIKI